LLAGAFAVSVARGADQPQALGWWTEARGRDHRDDDPDAAGGADEPEAATIYLLSWKGGVSPNRLILVGTGVWAVMAAGPTFLTVRFPIERVRPAVV